MTYWHKGARVGAARTGLVAAGVGLAAAVEVATYPAWRRWCVQWGATALEAARSLPGDDLLAEPQIVTTRAITIEAAPELIWPWLVQFGPGRGGVYTYDWIENLLGLNMHSVGHVLPEFQHPQVGDGFGYGPNQMIFKRVEPEHVLAAQSADGNWVWTFVIDGTHDGKTRLISRNRFRLPKLKDKVGMIPMEPASLLMERKMLHGIKKLAEKLNQTPHEAAHL